MLENNAIIHVKLSDLKKKPAILRKYHSPRLEYLGDLRTLTLGGSPGPGESAHDGMHKTTGPGGF